MSATCVVEGNTAIVGTDLPRYVDLGPEVVAISPEASQASTIPPLPSTVLSPPLEEFSIVVFSNHCADSPELVIEKVDTNIDIDVEHCLNTHPVVSTELVIDDIDVGGDQNLDTSFESLEFAEFVDMDMSCTCDKANMCTICAEINAAIVGADFNCFAGTNVSRVEGVDVINKYLVLPIMQPPPSPIEPKPKDEHKHHSNILRKLHLFLRAK